MEIRKALFAASSGGHLEQLLMLRSLMEKYDSVIVTEKTDYSVQLCIKTYYLRQINRKQWYFMWTFLLNSLNSLKIYCRERPDVVVCTGALATIPICLLAKLFGKKLIFIESFAKVTSPTLTGKLLYRFADLFLVQWPQMKEFYPDAVFVGGIY